MPYLFKLECGHIIKDYSRSRYNNFKYKGLTKTTCYDCEKTSIILNAGHLEERY